MGQSRTIDAAQYLSQSAAAAAWFDDVTDRLHRAGARRVCYDCWEIPAGTDIDALIRETLENKGKVLEETRGEIEEKSDD